MTEGIVTRNFEEQGDSMVHSNHLSVIQERINKSLRSIGKEYTGQDFDGLLYPDCERIIIGTHKGPMLAKFENQNPDLEVLYKLKKKTGSGKNSLTGRREVALNWFRDGCRLSLHPSQSSVKEDVVGWTDKGVDFSKAGSIYGTLVEWLPKAGISSIDSVTMGGILDALSGRENYTMMFIKAVLLLRTLSVGYSVQGSKVQTIRNLPGIVIGNKEEKIGQIGQSQCVIDLDQLNDREAMVVVLSSVSYPSMICEYDGIKCVYSNMRVPKCDTKLLSASSRRMNKQVPTPERWWKAVVGLACKLGAVGDLVQAFRVTRGLGSWLDGLSEIGLMKYTMMFAIPQTRGCRSVLMDSNLSCMDKIYQPSNMASSLGELVCDWGAGLEMRNMLMHLSDELGLGNRRLNRNVSKKEECSVGDSLLREAGFFHLGRENRFYNDVAIRLRTGLAFLGNLDLKRLIKSISGMMLSYADLKSKGVKTSPWSFKNMAFSAYYGPVWKENGTKVIGSEGIIDTWGTAKKRSDVYNLRCWLDVYGLSEEILMLCGYNSVQKAGVEAIMHASMTKISGANGVYSEVYREVNWIDGYEPRSGSETLEKDFVKTYLG